MKLFRKLIEYFCGIRRPECPKLEVVCKKVIGYKTEYLLKITNSDARKSVEINSISIGGIQPAPPLERFYDFDLKGFRAPSPAEFDLEVSDPEVNSDILDPKQSSFFRLFTLTEKSFSCIFEFASAEPRIFEYSILDEIYNAKKYKPVSQYIITFDMLYSEFGEKDCFVSVKSFNMSIESPHGNPAISYRIIAFKPL